MGCCWQPPACPPFDLEYINSLLEFQLTTMCNSITLRGLGLMPRMNWKRSEIKLDTNPTLRSFERWLKEHGYRDACIETYRRYIKKYLNEVKRANPSIEDAKKYHSDLANSTLARSSVNIQKAALKVFYRMQGEDLELPHLKVNNKVAYYFTEADVLAILSACDNMKHYTMLSLTFYCMLRVSDLINLVDEDIDLKGLSLRIRDGKFGKSALLPIPPDCAPIIESYLEARPKIQVAGKTLLFYTDHLNKWTPRAVGQMFRYHKEKAGISKPGGIHCFGRHSPASIMVKHGCDLYSLQQLMRHSSIRTTCRYLHMDDATLREKHNRYLTL